MHGDLQKVLACLEMAGVLAEDDGHIKWVGGDATVVQLGDVLDRGDCEIGARRGWRWRWVGAGLLAAGCWGGAALAACLTAAAAAARAAGLGNLLRNQPASSPAAPDRLPACISPLLPPAGSVLLLRELDRQARQAGGAVYMLNGNHESLNVAGDFR